MTYRSNLWFSRFDAVIISSEVGYEKPDARIFKAALGIQYVMIMIIWSSTWVYTLNSFLHQKSSLSFGTFCRNSLVDGINVDTEKAVHVGDDQVADKEGANAMGLHCWWVSFQWSHYAAKSLFHVSPWFFLLMLS